MNNMHPDNTNINIILENESEALAEDIKIQLNTYEREMEILSREHRYLGERTKP